MATDAVQEFILLFHLSACHSLLYLSIFSLTGVKITEKYHCNFVDFSVDTDENLIVKLIVTLALRRISRKSYEFGKQIKNSQNERNNAWSKELPLVRVTSFILLIDFRSTARDHVACNEESFDSKSVVKN